MMSWDPALSRPYVIHEPPLGPLTVSAWCGPLLMAKGVDTPRIRNARTFQRTRLRSSTSLVAMTCNVPRFMFPLYPMLLFASHAFLLFSIVLIVICFRSRLGMRGLDPSLYDSP